MFWTSPDFWQGFISGVVINAILATVAWTANKIIRRISR